MNTEHRDLLHALAERRQFLRGTVRDLTDAQAAERTTVSELCLSGLIKHVASAEACWAAFIVGGAAGMAAEEATHGDREDHYRVLPGETLMGILDSYQNVATRTDAVIASLPDLDVSYQLPDEPWFPPNASWSARRAILHMIGETAHHAGHADILREAIDGAKSMG